MADSRERMADKDALMNAIGEIAMRYYDTFCGKHHDDTEAALSAVATALLQHCALLTRAHEETKESFLSLAAECWDAVEYAVERTSSGSSN
jgi:hypothetical protein